MFFMSDGSVRFPQLGLEMEHLSKGIVIFGIHISFYGLLLACAMLLGLLLTEYLAKKSKQNPELYLEFAIFAIISGILGARLFYVIQHWTYYKQTPQEIFSLRSDGLSFFGGLLAGFFCACFFCKRKKYDVWRLCDTAVIGVLLGQIIGRWGDFFNRDIIGTPSDGFFAMQLETKDINAGLQKISLASMPGGEGIVQVHPIFLYEILWNMLLFVIVFIVHTKKSFRGQIFSLYLFGYGLIRFLTEFVRADAVTFELVGHKIRLGHLGGGLAVLTGMLLYLYFYLIHTEKIKS